MKLRYTTEEVIEKFKEIHKDKYRYEHFVYNGSHTKSIVTCPVHGDFLVTPNKHLLGRGCPKCANNIKLTDDEFKRRIVGIFGEKYLLSEANYQDCKSKIKLYCKEHGYFISTAYHLLQGHGCPKCAVKKNADKKRLTISDCIEKFRGIHGDKYDYSKMKYINIRTKVCIICPEHGEFWQYPYQHIDRKNGCPKCGNIATASKLSKTREDFIKDAIKVHGDKYTFKDTIYKNSTTRIKVNCRKHGMFEILPSNLLQGYGCPKCRCTCSKEENEVANFIGELNVESEKIKLENGQELDIYIPDKKIAFEFDGLYWHCELKKDKYYHSKKTYYCKEQGIRLIHIFEDEWLYKRDIVKSNIRYLLHKNINRIYGRKCIIKVLNKDDTKCFLDKNSIKEISVPSINYGLIYDGEIVSIMSFKNIRNKAYELMVFCNLLNTTITGGFAKLLKSFISDFNPSCIVSYVDKRWDNGELFDDNGFKHIRDKNPDYSYIIGHKRETKTKYRKKNLIDQGFDANKTENEIMLERGIPRIYDCGTMVFEMRL